MESSRDLTTLLEISTALESKTLTINDFVRLARLCHKITQSPRFPDEMEALRLVVSELLEKFEKSHKHLLIDDHEILKEIIKRHDPKIPIEISKLPALIAKYCRVDSNTSFQLLKLGARYGDPNAMIAFADRYSGHSQNWIYRSDCKRYLVYWYHKSYSLLSDQLARNRHYLRIKLISNDSKLGEVADYAKLVLIDLSFQMRESGEDFSEFIECTGGVDFSGLAEIEKLIKYLRNKRLTGALDEQLGKFDQKLKEAQIKSLKETLSLPEIKEEETINQENEKFFHPVVSYVSPDEAMQKLKDEKPGTAIIVPFEDRPFNEYLLSLVYKTAEGVIQESIIPKFIGDAKLHHSRLLRYVLDENGKSDSFLPEDLAAYPRKTGQKIQDYTQQILARIDGGSLLKLERSADFTAPDQADFIRLQELTKKAIVEFLINPDEDFSEEFVGGLRDEEEFISVLRNRYLSHHKQAVILAEIAENIGRQYLALKKHDKVIAWFNRAAELYHIEFCYSRLKVEELYAAMKDIFTYKQSTQEDSNSLITYLLGKLAFADYRETKNENKFKEAAALGHVGSILHLAYKHQSIFKDGGSDPIVNLENAAKWYEKAISHTRSKEQNQLIIKNLTELKNGLRESKSGQSTQCEIAMNRCLLTRATLMVDVSLEESIADLSNLSLRNLTKEQQLQWGTLWLNTKTKYHLSSKTIDSQSAQAFHQLEIYHLSILLPHPDKINLTSIAETIFDSFEMGLSGIDSSIQLPKILPETYMTALQALQGVGPGHVKRSIDTYRAAIEFKNIAIIAKNSPDPLQKMVAAHCYLLSAKANRQIPSHKNLYLALVPDLYRGAYQALTEIKMSPEKVIKSICDFLPEVIASANENLQTSYINLLLTCILQESRSDRLGNIKLMLDVLFNSALTPKLFNHVDNSIEVFNKLIDVADQCQTASTKNHIIEVIEGQVAHLPQKKLQLFLYDRLSNYYEKSGQKNIIQYRERAYQLALELNEPEFFQQQLKKQYVDLLFQTADQCHLESKRGDSADMKAEPYYQKAAKMGDPRAKLKLAILKQDNEKSKEEAAKLFSEALLAFSSSCDPKQVQLMLVQIIPLIKSFAELDPNRIRLENVIVDLFNGVQKQFDFDQSFLAEQKSYLKMLVNIVKDWLKNPNLCVLSEKNLDTLLLNQLRWAFYRDADLNLLTQHYFLKTKKYNQLLAYNLKLMENRNIALEEGVRQLKLIPAHERSDQIVQQINQLDQLIKCKNTNKGIFDLLLISTSSEFPEQIVKVAVDFWITKHANAYHLESIFDSEKALRQFYNNLSAPELSNSPFLEYAKHEFIMQLKKSLDTLATLIQFDLDCSMHSFHDQSGTELLRRQSELLWKLSFVNPTEKNIIEKIYGTLPHIFDRLLETSKTLSKNNPLAHSILKRQVTLDAIKNNDLKKLRKLAEEDNLLALAYLASHDKKMNDSARKITYQKILVLTEDQEKAVDRYQIPSDRVSSIRQEALDFLKPSLEYKTQTSSALFSMKQDFAPTQGDEKHHQDSDPYVPVYPQLSESEYKPSIVEPSAPPLYEEEHLPTFHGFESLTDTLILDQPVPSAPPYEAAPDPIDLAEINLAEGVKKLPLPPQILFVPDQQKEQAVTSMKKPTLSTLTLS